MPRLADVVRIEGDGSEALMRAAARARSHSREREDRWQKQRQRRLIERLMQQRKAAGE